MGWPRYLLLAACITLPSCASVIPRQELECDFLDYFNGGQSKYDGSFCPVGYWCDWPVGVCRPQDRSRHSTDITKRGSPGNTDDRECDPLAILSSKQSKWCRPNQYCDPFMWVCKPSPEVQLEAAAPVIEPLTTLSTREVNPVNPEAPVDNSRGQVFARIGVQERDSLGFGTNFLLCPDGKYFDSTRNACSLRSEARNQVAVQLTPPSATQSPSSDDSSCWRRATVVSEVAQIGSPPARSHSSGTNPDTAGESLGPPILAIVPVLGSVPGPSPAPQHPNPGSFAVVGDSGVPAMHAALMPNGRVVFLDKVENYSPLYLGDGRMAFSSEFDPATSKVVPLAYETNAFCSAGTFLADGRLLSLGGNDPLPYFDPTILGGFDGIRYLERSATDQSLDGTSWSEPGNKLASKRWYASAQTMPDGSVFVASGSLTGLVITNNANNNPTYEVLDANAVTNGRSIQLDILVKNQPYYLYPFLHLLRDGSLFVFTSKSSQIFDVSNNRIVEEMPDLEGLYRTYPDSGGSVMLPLTSQNGYAADVMICGGGAYVNVTSPTEASCGRIQPESDTPTWEMDAMPEGRVMVEGTLLPDGTVLWLNGAHTGAQGFGIADDPALDALIYDPEKALGQRWSVAGRSEIARLYHSVAVLLLDGTVLVAGGNPNQQPVLPQNVNPSVMEEKYPTEYRVEIYTPPYLTEENAAKRPRNVVISADRLHSDGSAFDITFTAPEGGQHGKVLLSHGGFVTHGLHMGHRMVVLDHEGGAGEAAEKQLRVRMPDANLGNNVLPPGPYVLYVVVDGVPSVGQFVMVG